MLDQIHYIELKKFENFDFINNFGWLFNFINLVEKYYRVWFMIKNVINDLRICELNYMIWIMNIYV